jgi:NH3-dependent NAD+ synthetase
MYASISLLAQSQLFLVVVGMSGGVDSSVAARLLANQVRGFSPIRFICLSFS